MAMHVINSKASADAFIERVARHTVRGEFSPASYALALRNAKRWVAEKFLATLEEYNLCCAVCGTRNPLCLQLDHVIPQSLGGVDDPSNWQVLCNVCNNVKNDLPGLDRLPPRQPEADDMRQHAAQCAWIALMADHRQTLLDSGEWEYRRKWLKMGA